MTSVAEEEVSLAVFYAFAIFVLALTFSIALAQIALGVSLVLYLFSIKSRRVGPTPTRLLRWVMWVAVAYIVWLAVTSLAGATPLASLKDMREEWLFLAVPLGIAVFRDAQQRSKIVMVLATGIAVISIYACFQHWTGVHPFRSQELVAAPDGGFRVTGLFTHRLTFANVFSVAGLFLWAFAFRKEGWEEQSLRRLFVLFAAILAMVASGLTYSRGPIAAIVIGLVMTAILGGRRYAIRSLGIVVLATTVLLVLRPGLTTRFTENFNREIEGTYEGSRMFIWEHSATIIGEHPLLGVGRGNFKPEYAKTLDPAVPDFRIHAHAHNDFLNVLAVAGIPGGVLFITLWAVILAGIYKVYRAGRTHPEFCQWGMAALVGSVVFLVNSMVEATFADEEVRQLLMFVWAAGLWPLWSRKAVLVETAAGAGSKTS